MAENEGRPSSQVTRRGFLKTAAVVLGTITGIRMKGTTSEAQVTPVPTPIPQEQPLPNPVPTPAPITPIPTPVPKEQLEIQIGQLGLPSWTLPYLSISSTFYLIAIFILVVVLARRNHSTLEAV